MKTKLVIVSAVIIGMAALLVIQHQAQVKMREQNQTLQQQHLSLAGQIQQMQSERDDATNRLASLADEISKAKRDDTELLKLRGEVAQMRTMQQQPVNSSNVSSTTNSANGSPNVMTIQGLISGVKTTSVARMKNFLNLTDEQAQAIQDILDSIPDKSQQKEQIRALLTPAQQTAYDELNEVDARASAIQGASQDVANLQSLLGLTAEQQDQVLNALVANQLSATPLPTSAALAGILTPDEIEQYRQYQANRPTMTIGTTVNTKSASGGN